MKFLLLPCLAALFLCRCGSRPEQDLHRQAARIDSLEKLVAGSYRPGLGEFMSGIQLHHEKLWFAAKNENWELADFEIHEIIETLDDINLHCKDRPEIRYLPMIDPPLDSLSHSIQQKNGSAFKAAYTSMTNTCNSCHQATQHAFNVIKVPETNPFPDQEFIPRQAAR